MRAKRKWNIQFESRDEFPEPFGYTPTIANEPTDKKKQSQEELISLKQRKAWDVSTAPLKSLFMTAFLMWMSGNQVHIFPIIITVMALWNPIKALLSVNTAFQSFEDSRVNVTLPKLVYILFNLVAVGMGILKCKWMGLLPNAADWMITSPSKITEFSTGVIQS